MPAEPDLNAAQSGATILGPLTGRLAGMSRWIAAIACCVGFFGEKRRNDGGYEDHPNALADDGSTSRMIEWRQHVHGPTRFPFRANPRLLSDGTNLEFNDQVEDRRGKRPPRRQRRMRRGRRRWGGRRWN